MRVPLPLRRRSRFHVVGLGLNTDDHVCVVRRPPRFAAKEEMSAYLRQPGGQVPTALVALQRWGKRTAYIGAFSDDDGGRAQRADLDAEGVDISACVTRAGVSGPLSIIMVDAVSGERTILWRRPSGLALTPGDLDSRALRAGAILFLDGVEIDSAILAARCARAVRAIVVLDIDEPGPRTEELLALADVAVVPETFPGRFTGYSDLRHALRRIGRLGPRVVAATLGAGGVLACDGGAILHEPAFAVRVVDTTSAGDLFHAGCLYGLLQEWPLRETLRFASVAAALECEHLGGRAAIPSLKGVKSRLGYLSAAPGR